jgi:hypothetical protein
LSIHSLEEILPQTWLHEDIDEIVVRSISIDFNDIRMIERSLYFDFPHKLIDRGVIELAFFD